MLFSDALAKTFPGTPYSKLIPGELSHSILLQWHYQCTSPIFRYNDTDFHTDDITRCYHFTVVKRNLKKTKTRGTQTNPELNSASAKRLGLLQLVALIVYLRVGLFAWNARSNSLQHYYYYYYYKRWLLRWRKIRRLQGHLTVSRRSQFRQTSA